MRRCAIEPRPGWQARVEELGFEFHTIDGETYWDESACYRFTSAEIDKLEAVTNELQEICIAAAQHVIDNKLYGRLAIPDRAVPLIEQSWEADEPSVYGRFDIAWDGTGEPKLLEYNADTPTSLLEASVVQWYWLQDRFPDADQFNSIHERLVDWWKQWPYLKDRVVHFSCVRDSREDLGTIEYLRDTAIQGGLSTRQVFIEDIGWNDTGFFVDAGDDRIETLVKLYPWEWLLGDEFGRHMTPQVMRVVEPAWKMLLSNKGLLPVLWELHPGHPNLLEASFDAGAIAGDHVKKPLLSREGANVTVVSDGTTMESDGSYGSEGYVYQRFHRLTPFDGNIPVIGSWVIGGEAAGIGIREEQGVITTDASRFVPHLFEEA